MVEHVSDAHADDFIARRLRDLGFVPGEPVRVVAHGPWGTDPLLIQIGSTRFALRRAEAGRVSVKPAQLAQPVKSGSAFAAAIPAGATSAAGVTAAGAAGAACTVNTASTPSVTSATRAPGMVSATSAATDTASVVGATTAARALSEPAALSHRS